MTLRPLLLVLLYCLPLLVGCPPVGDDDDDASGIDILGGGTHSLDNVQLDVIATADDDLNTPRDLEFHPIRTDELWVVNRETESVTILFDAGTDDQWTQHIDENFAGPHFLAQPSALAFNRETGDFATIHETDEPTQGTMTPFDFMGPTWWTSDLPEFNGGHEGHLDMLHNSPLGMGIAWEQDSVWWVFDGYHSSLTRYDFNDDHGLGGTDHSDGEIQRWVEGEVDRRGDVPSHMEVDRENGLLYVADTGNIRVCVLDIEDADAFVGDITLPNYDVSPTQQYEMRGASLNTLIDGDDFNLSKPSGLALHDGKLWISDARRSQILAFTLDGELIDWLELERDEFAINGIEFGPDGSLWVADQMNDEILRISVPSS